MIGIARRSLLIVALLSASTSAMAVPCVVLPVDGEIVVVSIDGSGSERTSNRLQSSHCESLRLVSGRADVIFWTEAGVRRIEVERGFVLPAEVRANPPEAPNVFTRMFQAVGDALAGAERRRLGRVRGSSPDVLASALPDGRVFPPQGALRISLPIGPDERVDSFVLRSATRNAFVSPAGARDFSIPAAVLRAGESYAWKLVVDGRSFSGVMAVVTTDVADAARRDAEARGAASGATGPARALVVSAALADAGFEWEGRRMIAAAFDD